jgi:hypothetical protein
MDEDGTARAELDRVRQAAARVDRAVDAVLAVRAPLTELLVSLAGAQRWGRHDLETRSIGASVRKHGELDQARLHQLRLQTLLARHRPELEALGRADPLIARITPLDVFHDLAENWLVDWVVQGKIKESIG